MKTKIFGFFKFEHHNYWKKIHFCFERRSLAILKNFHWISVEQKKNVDGKLTILWFNVFCLDLDCESTQLIQRSKGEYLMKRSFQPVLSVEKNSDPQRRLRVCRVFVNPNGATNITKNSMKSCFWGKSTNKRSCGQWNRANSDARDRFGWFCPYVRWISSVCIL